MTFKKMIQKFLEWLIEQFEEWFTKLINKLKKDWAKNGVFLVLSVCFMIWMADVLYKSHGWITLLSYLFTTLYGITRAIDKPGKVVVWGIGFFFGAVVIDLLFENFIPVIKGGDAVSIISGLMILYVVAALWSKSQEMKHA